MNKINYKDVPGCFLHCIQSDCKMADHCLHQLAMQALPDNYKGVMIANPKLTSLLVIVSSIAAMSLKCMVRALPICRLRCYQVSTTRSVIDFRASLVAILTSNVARASDYVRLVKSKRLRQH